MSRQDRITWENKGSPFRLMRPAAAVRDKLRAHGYTVYDLGNEEHLEHEPPEDHTPYSETGWPSRAKYGVGHAIDIMPPKPGQRSKLTGKPLPSLQQLGAQMYQDKQAGHPGMAWLKYMNWEPERNNGGPCYHDSWQPNHVRRSSTDRGHIHQSGRTDYIDSATADGYDPIARLTREDDDMPLTKAQDGALVRVNDMWGGNHKSPWQNRLDLTLAAILAAARNDDEADIKAFVEQKATELAQGQAAMRDAILAALPEGDGPVSREDLVAALRSVLGSVDEAA